MKVDFALLLRRRGESHMKEIFNSQGQRKLQKTMASMLRILNQLEINPVCFSIQAW
jgi:hypothetical protein